MPVDSAVDRTKLIRIGYALVGLFLLAAIYTLLSPKDLLQTAERLAMPWADISAPTSTTISEVSPLDTQAFRGQQVTVECRVQGLPSDGKVNLFYTTADGQIVDRALEMTVPPGDYKHRVVLPSGSSSLEQSLSYRIAAGDATTRTYHVGVSAAPRSSSKASAISTRHTRRCKPRGSNIKATSKPSRGPRSRSRRWPIPTSSPPRSTFSVTGPTNCECRRTARRRKPRFACN